MELTDGVVTLRHPVDDDASIVAAAVRASLAELQPWMTWATDDFDEESALAWIRGEVMPGGEPFVVIDTDGELIGSCGLQPLDEKDLGHEWEWEETPEVSLKIVDDLQHAVDLCNRYSPQFIASPISGDEDEHRRFWGGVNAPFVGNGFTRWVDGQYALGRPELGLSNWQSGRLFGRGGVLSGDSVFTVRGRVRQTDPDVGR